MPQSATALSGVNNANDFAAFDINDNLSNNVGQLVAAQPPFAGTASLNVINPSTPSSTQTSGVSVSRRDTADTTNAGRYTLATTVDGAATPLNLVVYVASGGLLDDGGRRLNLRPTASHSRVRVRPRSTVTSTDGFVARPGNRPCHGLTSPLFQSSSAFRPRPHRQS